MSYNNIQNNIEASIISTMLFNESYLYEKAFSLESRYFTNPFHKILVERIIARLTKGESISLLNLRLEQYFNEQDAQTKSQYLEIISTLPLAMKVAEQYYEELKIQYKVRKVR